MPTFIALLRGVNVAGKNRIPMSEWKGNLERLGFKDVRTYLQSGNAVFSAAAAAPDKMASAIKAGISRGFGCEVEVLVLSRADIDLVAEANPLFPRLGTDETLFHATFPFHPIPAGELGRIKLPAQAGEQAVAAGCVIYLYCPNGYGRTKLNNTFFEKALKMPATTRNWRTVLALKSLCAEL
jgi:uncharacterized protein (DUF1697 family)